MIAEEKLAYLKVDSKSFDAAMAESLAGASLSTRCALARTIGRSQFATRAPEFSRDPSLRRPRLAVSMLPFRSRFHRRGSCDYPRLLRIAFAVLLLSSPAPSAPRQMPNRFGSPVRSATTISRSISCTAHRNPARCRSRCTKRWRKGRCGCSETGNVNSLAIENLGDQAVFVQAGDIVKGGQQDRTLTVSLLLPPKSGRVPIASFCVEHGRWSARGGEDARSFSARRSRCRRAR